MQMMEMEKSRFCIKSYFFSNKLIYAQVTNRHKTTELFNIITLKNCSLSQRAQSNNQQLIWDYKFHIYVRIMLLTWTRPRHPPRTY